MWCGSMHIDLSCWCTVHHCSHFLPVTRLQYTFHSNFVSVYVLGCSNVNGPHFMCSLLCKFQMCTFVAVIYLSVWEWTGSSWEIDISAFETDWLSAACHVTGLLSIALLVKLVLKIWNLWSRKVVFCQSM